MRRVGLYDLIGYIDGYSWWGMRMIGEAWTASVIACNAQETKPLAMPSKTSLTVKHQKL